MPAWTHLQGASVASSAVAGSSTPTRTCSFNSNLSSGSKIIAAISIADGSNHIGITSATIGSLTLTQIGIVNNTTAGHWAVYAGDTPAGVVGTAGTVTFNLTDSGNTSLALFTGICIQEVSGLATGTTVAAMCDGTVATKSVTTGSSSPQSVAYSSSVSGEYLLSFYGDDGGPTTVTGPYGSSVTDPSGSNTTSGYEGINTSNDNNCMLSWTSSTGGSESDGWTWTGTNSADLALITVAFKLATAAAPSTPPYVDVAALILHQFGFDSAFQKFSPSIPGLNASVTPGVGNVSVAANNPSVEVDAIVTPGVATVTVIAYGPTASLTGLPATPNVTVTGLDVNNPEVSAQPDTPNVVVTAYNPSASVAGDANANAGLANVNLAATNAVVAVTAVPQTANVTVTAPTVTVSTGVPVRGAQFPITYLLAVYGPGIFPVPLSQTGTNDTALPSFGNVNVAAFGPSNISIVAFPTTASVTVTAQAPAQQVSGTPPTPNVTAAALAPLPVVTALPDTPNVTVTAYNPSVTIGGNITAFPGVANVTVTAYDASVSAQGNVTVTPGVARAAVNALGPATNVSPAVTVAAVVAAAYLANPAVGAAPGVGTVNVVGIILAVSGTGAHIGKLTAAAQSLSGITAEVVALSEQDVDTSI